MAPNRLPWSVSASAGMPAAAAAAMTSSSRLAPSKRLYWLWRWRWTKSDMRGRSAPADVTRTAGPAGRFQGALEVPGLQGRAVMELVAGDGVGHRPYAHLGAVGDAAARPGLVGQGGEEGEARRAHDLELLRELGQPAAAEGAGPDVGILLEARERRAIGAREPQGAVGEDPLGVH